MSEVREVDEPIPDSEKLFRGVRAIDVDKGSLLPSFVDLDGCSCDREKYGGPTEAADGAKYVTVAWTTPGILGATRLDGDYLVFAVDDPQPDDSDHCEVRQNHKDAGHRQARKPKSPVSKAALRNQILQAFRLR